MGPRFLVLPVLFTWSDRRNGDPTGASSCPVTRNTNWPAIFLLGQALRHEVVRAPVLEHGGIVGGQMRGVDLAGFLVWIARESLGVWRHECLGIGANQ
ncbi:hypothetical protein GCM10010470_45720 [Saccharopolyspora taberi]|uniref:Secreted protein n=1 Tax=Saccharopolyspora taberi TaxID=60895 RepID=A0ABN3VIW5_9PSEU